MESANLEVAFEWAITTGDGEDALWLANAPGDFFYNRGRFEQILNWSERAAAKLVDHPDRMLWANAQNSLGSDYRNFPLGSKLDNLRRAITAYEEALRFWTPQTAPLYYAVAQNNLGTAYNDLAAIEDRADNLRNSHQDKD
jgi:tetratricopeptide (TPR) repeat protein